MKGLLLRVDATAQIGTGHLMRCLALAQAWQERGGRAVFISRCESEALRERITAEGFHLIPLDKVYPDPFDWDFTKDIIDKQKIEGIKSKIWLVVDGYHFDAEYQKSIKAKGYKLLWIDDYGHANHYYADIVLNQNILTGQLVYSHRETYTRILQGPRYILLRREYQRWRGWRREIPTIGRKILVTMGGTDQDNVTLKAIKSLKQVNGSGLEARIIVGPGNPYRELLQKEISTDPRLHLLSNVKEMSELMAWADLAISAGGSTCWELAFMGLPSITLIVAENQRVNGEALDREGISINLGWHYDIKVEMLAAQIKRLMTDSKKRSLISQRGQELVDGYGGRRICNIMQGEGIKLRSVLAEDCERVWEWRNEDAARAASLSKKFISWEEHSYWFPERIKRPFFYIALNQDDLPIGQIRFDQEEAETVISVTIDKVWRHCGYGVRLIKMSCEELFLSSDIKVIHAYIKPDNEASTRTFRKAGFKEAGTKIKNGQLTNDFILTKS